MSTNLKLSIFSLAAVRHDRMRGGRNKFGPMYKRDRARKLQVIRQRQVFTSHSGLGGGGQGHNNSSNVTIYGGSGGGSNSSPMYTSSLHIKQEIQIPQVRGRRGRSLAREGGSYRYISEMMMIVVRR